MRSFTSTDPVGHEGQTSTWLTPLPLIHSLGEFDFDPCGFPGHLTAKKVSCWPTDGLSIEWTGRVWLNPPYGRDMWLWIKKLQSHGDGIGLVFSRTDTKWFHSLEADMIFFIQGRLSFLKPDLSFMTNAGVGSMLIVYGKENVNAVLRSGLKGMAMYQKDRDSE